MLLVGADSPMIASTNGEPAFVLSEQRTESRSTFGINVVKYDSTGQYCVSGGTEKLLKIWNMTEKSLITSFEGHTWEVFDLAISQDRTKMVSGGGDKCVFVWDVVKGSVDRKFFGHSHRINSVAFSSNASVVASASYDTLVKLWDMRSHGKAPLQILKDAKDSVSHVAFTDNEIITAYGDFSKLIFHVVLLMAVCDVTT